MLRLYIPIILFAIGTTWGLHKILIKKSWKQGREILGITIFFALAWLAIYYWLFSESPFYFD